MFSSIRSGKDRKPLQLDWRESLLLILFLRKRKSQMAKLFLLFLRQVNVSPCYSAGCMFVSVMGYKKCMRCTSGGGMREERMRSSREMLLLVDWFAKAPPLARRNRNALSNQHPYPLPCTLIFLFISFLTRENFSLDNYSSHQGNQIKKLARKVD